MLMHMEKIYALVRSHGAYIVAAVILFGAGAFTSQAVQTSASVTASSTAFALTLDSDVPYQFIRPLIGVGVPRAYGAETLAPLHAQIAQTAAQMPNGSLVRYAYYFRDLTNGKWTGINETDQYDPASTLKLVFAVGVYKQEEVTPGFINQSFVYTPQIANLQSQFAYAPAVNLQVGASYSVPYLLKEMLSDSDNGAKDLLLTHLDTSLIDKMFSDLSITKPVNSDSPNFTISPQD